MSSQAFPFTEEELNKAGLLGEGVSNSAASVIETMRKHPELLKLSLFALECINNHQGEHVNGLGSARPISPTLSNTSFTTHVSALSMTSKSTVVSKYAPDEYERTAYYNGITGDGDHPELIYRSDFQTTSFPKPSGRYAHVPVKSLRGVFDTPLNKVWGDVGPQIRDIIKRSNLRGYSVDPARFFTHGPLGEEAQGTLGPVVIWIGALPSSTSSETAHEVSQQILALLHKNRIDDVVVEWREAEPQKLAGPPLLRHVGTGNATHHVRHFLTALLGVPLATKEMENEDSQGTLTLWFHENKDKNGNPSDRVLGLSNCHVLRKDTTTKYELRGSGAKNYVHVCGMRRFQRGLDDITKAMADRGMLAEYYARDIAMLQAKQDQDQETVKEIRRLQRKLEEEEEAVIDLEGLHIEVTKSWSNIKMQRNIGYVQYAPAISVADDTHFTSDWAVFVAAKAKVKPEFEGNVVDLGSKYAHQDLAAMFYPVAGGLTTFKFPEQRKLRIEACASQQDLAVPAEFDAEGQRCLMVGKDGNTTGLTVGRYAGLVSFIENEVGIESIELGIYNAGLKTAEVFSAKGDSGSLVWHMRDGKACIVGQLHSGRNKGGLTSNHISYCTPGWYLLNQVKDEYKHADFYRRVW